VTFDPEAIIAALDRHGVRYVIVGGVAARLHGSPTLTEDVDVTPERSTENLTRLAAALEELDARLAAPNAPEGLRVPLDSETFSSPVMSFSTSAGVVDVVLEVLGVGGHARLDRDAVPYEVHGIRIRVASLDDIIRSKEAASRPKDRAHLETLRVLREELDRD
jgi:hypothetical protein